MSMGIVEFLEARIGEDEAAANRCAAVFPGSWDVEDRGYRAHIVCDGPQFHYVSELNQQNTSADWLGGVLGMIADFQPARVLAECAAKRAIIKECERLEQMRIDVNLWNMDYPEDTILRPLAAIYRDHPEYQAEWAL